MPVFFQQDIDADTKLAVWRITEDEAFFLQHVPLQRSITHPHKRLQHLAGRYLLQYLFPDFPISLIKIADTRKPFLENEAYHFSISHCANYAAAIVSKTQRVGVDIEVPTEKVRRIRHKFLHSDESAWVSTFVVTAADEAVSNPQSKQPFCSESDLLTLLWSAKEAVFKWWSYGAVDFSEMIRLEAFYPEPEGVINGRFVSDAVMPLQLQYRLFEGLCLAWVADNGEVSSSETAE